jgi:hypothetical protein
MSVRVYDNYLHYMEVMGGSFARSLAMCYYAADSNNKSRLLAAFPEVFNRYKTTYEENLRLTENLLQDGDVI